jgi:hypothetical protein
MTGNRSSTSVRILEIAELLIDARRTGRWGWLACSLLLLLHQEVGGSLC